jgi:hypothetical protein
MKKRIVWSSQNFSSSNFKSCILLALFGIFLMPLAGHAAEEAMVKTSSGLQYADLVVGSGREAHAGGNGHSPLYGDACRRNKI